MLAPVLAGVAALYGYYRWNKAKETRALLTAPPGYTTAPLPNTLPQVSQKTLSTLARIVKPAAPVNPLIYGAGAVTSDIPSGRIPSSAYGTGGGSATTPPASAVQYTAQAGFQFKI